MNNTHGTCGNCGGRITSPMHSVKPVLICESCGSTPRESYGPVMKMNPPKAYLDAVREKGAPGAQRA